MSLLHGFGVADFRSFGPDLEYLQASSRVHLLAGPNDAGKSNLLRALQVGLSGLREDSRLSAPADRPHARPDAPMRVAVRLAVPEELRRASGLRLQRLLDVTDGPSFRGPSPARGALQHRWIEMEAGPAGGPAWVASSQQLEDIQGRTDALTISRLAVALDAETGEPGFEARQVLDVLFETLGGRAALPRPSLIGLGRRASAQTAPQTAVSDLVERIGSYLLHGGDKLARQRLRDLREFVAEVIDVPEVELTLDRSNPGKGLFVAIGRGPSMPLSNHGAGLEQIVVIAERATDPDHQLVLLEEPEAHLHPHAQRRLLSRLSQTGEAQFVVATHSPHLLDAPGGTISAVRRDGPHTRLQPAVEDDEVVEVGRRLGIRASDLLQSNAAVWVEGPSDRVYMRHWLSVADARLRESVHYSIVPYGGSLVRHLGTGRGSADLVSLPRLNRNLAIVLDSDKTAEGEPLASWRQAIVDALESDGTVTVWVTEGRTIENYLRSELLRQAVRVAHPRATQSAGGGLWDDLLGGGLSTASPDKTAIAYAVVELLAHDDAGLRDDPGLNAAERIAAIAAKIAQANGLPAVVGPA